MTNSSPLKLKARVAFAVVVLAISQFAIYAGNMSGAIYTTDFVGAAVNQNIYGTQFAVYISGGPNNNNSAGLPANEVFYFEVTDPSGNQLLSTDPAQCRQVQTDGQGRIFAVAGGSCSHSTGVTDVSNGALPVQLWPFAKTPNNGNEYKVTLVRKNAPGVSIIDDGYGLDYPKSAAKSDNFKIPVYRLIDE